MQDLKSVQQRRGLEDEVRGQEYGGKEATGREAGRGQNINDCFLLVLFVVFVFATAYIPG